MDAAASDDKLQAVVSVVLQAVDQRLALVREQLLQITTIIAHNHAELSRRIDDCQRLGEAAIHASTTGTGQTAATGQLVQAANMLTERVEFLESRVNQYTDDRIAEVAALIEGIGGIASTTPAPSAVAPERTVAVAPALARLAPLGAITAPAVVAAMAPAPVPAQVPAPAPVAAVTPVPAVAPAPAPVEQPVDIALLSAQMSERLAAAVDRALGAMPAGGGVPANSA